MLLRTYYIFFFKACDIGRYGLNCQHVCGHCFKAEQCFHTNGSCFGGCMEEYRGEMCSESSCLVFRMLYVFKPITFKLYKVPLHLSQWSFYRKENISFIHYGFKNVSGVIRLTHHIAKIV